MRSHTSIDEWFRKEPGQCIPEGGGHELRVYLGPSSLDQIATAAMISRPHAKFLDVFEQSKQYWRELTIDYADGSFDGSSESSFGGSDDTDVSDVDVIKLEEVILGGTFSSLHRLKVFGPPGESRPMMLPRGSALPKLSHLEVYNRMLHTENELFAEPFRHLHELILTLPPYLDETSSSWTSLLSHNLFPKLRKLRICGLQPGHVERSFIVDHQNIGTDDHRLLLEHLQQLSIGVTRAGTLKCLFGALKLCSLRTLSIDGFWDGATLPQGLLQQIALCAPQLRSFELDPHCSHMSLDHVKSILDELAAEAANLWPLSLTAVRAGFKIGRSSPPASWSSSASASPIDADEEIASDSDDEAYSITSMQANCGAPKVMLPPRVLRKYELSVLELARKRLPELTVVGVVTLSQQYRITLDKLVRIESLPIRPSKSIWGA
ncbi:hypothetical protein DL93DRAFT_2089502 [Clavulina sp. PMI_390]|nr:hypothetical protein DL93DRAFT_2089502 [Clavulina sp. PMI_390]